jgi:hypothetical protein
MNLECIGGPVGMNGASFRIVVDGADALDAFNHPYAYLEAA